MTLFSCEKLRSIEISDSTEVAEDCFQGCSNLSFNNCEQSYDKRIVVFRGTLQSYGEAFWEDFAYCVEPLALPQIVERISIRLWKGLPDIVYHPLTGRPGDERKMLNGISVGDELLFGRFPQTSDCELMPLSWKVICVEKGRALLITNKAIISVYSDCFVRDMRSWEHSRIREWLNTCFLSVAFTEAEQKIIVPVMNTSIMDLGLKQEEGQDTKDAVFLLSFDEAKEFMKSDQDWRSEPTEYALMHHNCNGRWGCNAYWPTRTAGIKEGAGPVSILYNGCRINDGSQSCSYVLRPAIWVRI